MTKKALEPEPNDDLVVVSIGGETLTALQAELLYQAVTRAMGKIGERVSENRYDTEALAQLADATRIASLLVRAVPKKPKPKQKENASESDE